MRGVELRRESTSLTTVLAQPMLITAAEVDLANNKERISDEQRPMLGQSLPLGDTGNGQTGVPAGEQGISNRPGDHAVDAAAENDDGSEELEDEDEDEDEDAGDEDLDEDEDDGEDDALDDEENETTDPEAEPGKPV
jgi:hypothetical protein